MKKNYSNHTIEELQAGVIPAGMFWDNTSEYLNIYQEMLDADFSFTKASDKQFHQYYRYYNDGDLPGWARPWDNGFAVYKEWGLTRQLNIKGERELERRTAIAVLKEWKRYQKKQKKEA